MQIWLDTTDLPILEKAHRRGILQGVTTNPAMLVSNGKETLKGLLAAQPGPVAVEVYEGEVDSMVSQGKALHAFSARIVVKVPATERGFEALHILSQAQIPTMASAIVQPTQALVAAAGGALWVAPYFSRIMKAGDNPLAQLEAIKKMLGLYQMRTQILAVNPKTIEQIKSCAEIGINAVTIREDVFKDLIETHELTAHAIEQYDEDWKKIKSQEWF
jgi:TalC/MipB family fructose-6-phosphate aldolase